MSRKMKHGKWSEVVFATVLFLGAAGLLVLRFSISQNDLWQICGLLSALAAFLIIVRLDGILRRTLFLLLLSF